MSLVIDNLLAVRNAVSSACAVPGRDGNSVELLVVSKTIPVPVLRELYDFGVRRFGENREPELARKAALLPPDVEWQFIGPLQANKVRKVVKLARMIHSVSSLNLLERVERIAGEEGVAPEFLLEVNVSGEVSKGGLSPDELAEAAKFAVSCTHAGFRGLMTMAPLGAPEAELRAVFDGLRRLRDRTAAELNCDLPVLSMGMSGDFPTAIRCGATMVRVGSRIFQGIERELR